MSCDFPKPKPCSHAQQKPQRIPINSAAELKAIVLRVSPASYVNQLEYHLYNWKVEPQILLHAACNTCQYRSSCAASKATGASPSACQKDANGRICNIAELKVWQAQVVCFYPDFVIQCLLWLSVTSSAFFCHPRLDLYITLDSWCFLCETIHDHRTQVKSEFAWDFTSS